MAGLFSDAARHQPWTNTNRSSRHAIGSENAVLWVQNTMFAGSKKEKTLTTALHRLLYLTFGSNVRAVFLPKVQRCEHSKEPIEMHQLLMVP
jgi:hypothetical protein